MRIDLHTHSTVSDGTESPAEVMRAAAAAGLDVVALADHDAVDGWDEASAEAAALGIEFVPGIEVSAHDRWVSVHLLALWPRVDGSPLADMMERTRADRIERARRIVELIAQDYPLTWDDVVARAEGASTVGRPHIADALVAVGAFASRDEVFADVLRNGSAYYVPHRAPTVRAAIRAVRGAGGVPIFAHPGAHARGRTVPDHVIGELAAAGLAALEVDHRDHDDATRVHLAALADRHGLLATGASDYHGEGKLNRLGENLTSPEVYAALKSQRG